MEHCRKDGALRLADSPVPFPESRREGLRELLPHPFGDIEVLKDAEQVLGLVPVSWFAG